MAASGHGGSITQGMVQLCWACSTPNCLLMFSGEVVPLFKCQWCGALNTHSAALSTPALAPSQGQGDDGQQGAAPRVMLAAPRRPAPALAARVAGGAQLLAVLGLVGVVAVVGTAVLLPGAWPSPGALLFLHYPFTAFLALNVLFNYGVCVLGHPGPAQRAVAKAVAADGTVPQGAFAGYQYCERCRYYKPPAAHHCRRCGTCVCGMDHHCPFLGNQCVGEANLAPFLRFLAWLVLGAAYALAAVAAMGWRERQHLWRHTRRTWQASAQFSTAWRLASYTLRWALSAPLWMALWGGAGAVCALSALLVGLLLHRQLGLLAQGQTYLDALRSRQRGMQSGGGSSETAAGGVAVEQPVPLPTEPGGLGARGRLGLGGAEDTPLGVSRVSWESAGARALRGVFGDGHPLVWLFPLGPRRRLGGQAHNKLD